MNKDELETVFKALMTGLVFVEDQIDIEKKGLESGFKEGALQRFLKEINAAVAIVNAAFDEVVA